MANSRTSNIVGVNDWKAIYQTFREADFRSYDYETLRKSFIDYLRVYYPETFNDFTESSEFIALLDVMAFMGQGLAFRNDLNSRENFIDTAERRDSVVKLANLVSYTPKRNIAGQGYLKITSIRTTENVLDINNFNLSNIPILWNDPANPNWQNQFNAIINATLINSQRVGNPGNTAEIIGVDTEEYTISIPNTALPIIPFTSTIDGITMNFELVSVSSIDTDYIYELPPAPFGRFNILYRNDNLGFASPNSGFFIYFKQGTLTSLDFSLQQQIANQTIDIDIQGINNTDTWLFQLNNNNGGRTLWEKVDNVYADAYLQTETSRRRVFSVTSRFNDQVTYVFGDGVFSAIPVGNFRAYVRAGNALTYTIEPSEMQGISVSFAYISRIGKVETLSFTLALQTSVSTAQVREPIEQIKQRAPTRYYTQNRMVNGEDYNNFPYTLYSSIIKSKAINRSSVGVSKNLDLLDPTGKYSSITSYGSDGALYQLTDESFLTTVINNTNDIRNFLTILTTALGTIPPNQYYVANYPRYDVNQSTGDDTTYWQTSTVNTSSETGFFYKFVNLNKTPVPTGTFSATSMKYVIEGSMIKFLAPIGFYFDNDNRLVAGLPGPTNKTYFWTTVLQVVGDGFNSGDGQFANGLGPVTVSGYVPSGAIITTVIPPFSNRFNTIVIDEIQRRMELNQNFTLTYNNSLQTNQNPWSIELETEPDYFILFTNTGVNRYIVQYKSLNYYFGSVSDTRFAFSQDELVYDPFTGKTIQDNITILKINNQPNSSYPYGYDIKVNIIGQNIASDGYVNDYEIKVASTDINNRNLILNPDFFYEITGYQINSSNVGKYVFFELIENPITLSFLQIIPTSTVNYQYQNLSQIEIVKYDYPLGQLFFAYVENKFYKSFQDNTKITPFFVMREQPQYSVRFGRQGLNFQYKHNSNNTTRIDPATTNIIDLYIVTQSYYTAYSNYIQDTTNTIPKPEVPSITELSTTYSELNNYKMLSDNIVLNSVVFKPLFGPKADSALQATIKVIKASFTNASDSEIKSAVLTAMNNYFNINNWNFGDTFYFDQLSAYLHATIGEFISSAVLVSNNPSLRFGDLYEIRSMPYEIFVNAATTSDIQVIAALTQSQLQIR